MPSLTPDHLLQSLQAMTSSEAKRMWRESIKAHYNHQCVYCGSNSNLTLDHVRPRCRGGRNDASNLVAACRECNRSKGSSDVLDWFLNQPFFNPSTIQILPL
jgi:5-methylcytosine-specific restriction endonuclease McrA